MRVDELIGSLQTFEMGMCDGSKKKVKSIAFMSNTEEKEEESGQDIDEDLANDVALLGRQFNKLLKKMDVRSKSNVKNILTSVGTIMLEEEQDLMKSPKKEKEFSAMNVMGMDTLELNVGPTSRNRRRVLLLLGLMKVKQKESLPIL
jgi:hypothetical protein